MTYYEKERIVESDSKMKTRKTESRERAAIV